MIIRGVVEADLPAIVDICNTAIRAAMLTPMHDLLFFVAHDQVNHAGGIGNPKAVEVLPQLFDFVTARNPVDFQI